MTIRPSNRRSRNVSQRAKRRTARMRLAFGFLAVVALAPAVASAQSLRGGRDAMREQHNKGIEYDYTRLRDASHVMRFVELGLLERLPGNVDYTLHDVSFPFARPEVKLFVERLAAQYRDACGEQLVVTSLTRPLNRQPFNASQLSVHPQGMAVDFRRSNVMACRSWLERVLLQLENSGTIQATRERRPPHYHVAVYTRSYAAYVNRLEKRKAQEAHAVEDSRTAEVIRHEVVEGDSLWRIAAHYGTTVDDLRAANRLRSTRIYPGQVIRVSPPAR